MYRTHLLLLAIASAGALLLSGPAGAGQASTSFQVTATVGMACTLSANNLDFGPYTADGPVSPQSQSSISINCSDGTSSFPTGVLTLASSTGFAMTSGGASLDYDLYQDAAHSAPILSGQGLTVTPGAATVTIFGEIPAGQAVPDGSYSDTVSVVFDF